MKILVTCPYGLSALLAKELKRLQITPLETLETSVLADTDWKGIYTANLWSRLANKCYLVLGEGKVETFNQLFDVVGNLSRGEYLVSGDISVQVVSKHSQLSAERAIQSVSHKAILNALTSSVVVSGGGKHSVVTVVLYLDHDYLKVCLNTSGASLHQRGYRLHT
jgi:putative N6-adenine-specific DNA methylase